VRDAVTWEAERVPHHDQGIGGLSIYMTLANYLTPSGPLLPHLERKRTGLPDFCNAFQMRKSLMYTLEFTRISGLGHLQMRRT